MGRRSAVEIEKCDADKQLRKRLIIGYILTGGIDANGVVGIVLVFHAADLISVSLRRAFPTAARVLLSRTGVAENMTGT